MIVFISVDELFKKKKRRKRLLDEHIIRDFMIVNTTTLPKMRDLPKVMSDIYVDETGMRSPSSLDSLTYQMPDNAFNENLPEKKRQMIVDKFFMVQGFQDFTVKIIGWQIANPNKNVYIILDDNAYDKYVDRYVEEIQNMIEIESDIIFTWNSVREMKAHIRKQAEKHVSSFDPKKWEEENSIYSSMTVNLDDDAYDEYLDYKEMLDKLDSPDCSNGNVRAYFLKYGKYSEKQIKKLGEAVKRLSEQEQK